MKLEKAINFTKLSIAVICCWPPSPTVPKSQLLTYNILWCLSFSNSLILLIGLLCAIVTYKNDAVRLSTLICLASAVSQVCLKMLICRFQRTRLQALNHKMENFVRNANIRQRNILEKYVDQSKTMHIAYTIWGYMTAVCVVIGPLFLPQPLPTDAVYPFPVDHHPIKSIIYLHQSLAGLQASAGLLIDCYIGILLWFTIARFDMIAVMAKEITNEFEMKMCIKEHQEVLSYANDIKHAVRPLTLITVATTSLGTVFGMLNIITENQPLVIQAQYVLVVLSASIALFMCAWPAENLIIGSTAVSSATYCSNWSEIGLSTRKLLLQMIMRAQKPAVIKIGGIIPTLSMGYYTSFLSTIFSYFTALRVMIIVKAT